MSPPITLLASSHRNIVCSLDSKLRDGAKLEMRSVPDFDSTYEYIFNKCDAECQEYSDKTLSMKEALKAASD
jgi:hypothetical protein